jgi:ATP-dependent DNA helicase RecQ
MHPIEVLERYWNHTSFRPLQEDIIASVLNNEDTFALLPTGGGKSICFQIPALIKDGICIVVSPLVALMKDQVNQLKQRDIKAIALTSGLSYSDLDTQLDNCIYGNYKFLYLSPERLQQPIVQERIQQMNVNLIAVDEAHCISQWGNDFRPAYKNIFTLRELHPHVNCIALTATAKADVIKDTISSLDFLDAKIYKASFKRSNIVYNVIHTDDKNYQLNQLLNKHKRSSIIYVRNRKATIYLSNYLEAKGFSTTFYHGGITNKEKTERLQLWTSNQKRIMIATTAFGMGIDKPDVETVIHYNLPESLESYYQEAGRAGRDGNTAFAIILKKHVDQDHLKGQFLSTMPSIDFIKHVYNKLCNYFQIPYGEGEQTIHQLNFKDFCNTYNLKSGLTYNTLRILDRTSIIALNQQFNYKTKVQFLVSNPVLFQYLETHKAQNLVVKSLLRTYGGIFDFPTKINLDIIAAKANCPEKQLIAILKDLEQHDIISFDIANTDSEITFIKPREDDKTINPIIKIVTQQQKLKHQQVHAVIDYINNNSDCRSTQLLKYFGEITKEDCGMCSVCMTKKGNTSHYTDENISKSILKELHKQDLSSRQLLTLLPYTEKEILNTIMHLMEYNKIKITNTNKYQLSE